MCQVTTGHTKISNKLIKFQKAQINESKGAIRMEQISDSIRGYCYINKKDPRDFAHGAKRAKISLFEMLLGPFV